MNSTEVIEFLRNNDKMVWQSNKVTEDPYLGAYILPNLSPEKYPEYEQDYAELVKNFQQHDHDHPDPDRLPIRYPEDEKGIVRIEETGVTEFFEGHTDNGSFEEITGAPLNMTSKELADYILRIEGIFSLINEFNKKVCQKCGEDYDRYDYDCFLLDLFLLADCEKGEGMLGMSLELMYDDDGFYNGRLLFELFENGIEYVEGTMFNYFGRKNDVVIPEFINKIRSRAFFDTDVERISIPDDVGCYVEAYAFEHCENLKYVYFGSDVIVPERFYEGDELFDGPDTIFYGCDALECIEVSPDNLYISSEDGKLYNKDKTKLLYDPTDKSWWEEE